MTDKEALLLALEALEKNTKHLPADFDCHFEAITAIKEALAEHAMREVQRLGQEIEQERTWVGLTDEDMYVVSEEESCSFIAGAKWSEAILKEKNT